MFTMPMGRIVMVVRGLSSKVISTMFSVFQNTFNVIYSYYLSEFNEIPVSLNVYKSINSVWQRRAFQRCGVESCLS